MPLYLFECSDCGHQEERIQSYDSPPPVCGSCDEKMPSETPFMERKIGRSSFVLKGNGWAKDNYGLKSQG